MKFIHIADMHLDRTFEGLGNLPDKLSEKLAKESLNLLKQLVSVAENEEVDFVVIVGDTFHQPVIGINIQHQFIEAMEQLNRLEILVILTFGNHDYYQPNTYWFPFPKNVQVISSEKVETIQLLTKKGSKVAVSGFSYENRWLENSKVGEFPMRHIDADYHIGLYHGSIGRANDSQEYAPFTVGELKEKGYDYWALGHIHQPTVISENPPILYSGSPVGHTKKEADSRGFVVVKSEQKELNYDWHEYPTVKWLKETVTISKEMPMTHLTSHLLKLTLEAKCETTTIGLLAIEIAGGSQELKSSLEKELTSGGLVAYLQDQLYQQSGQKIWLYQLTQLTDYGELTLPYGISSDLVAQLSQKLSQNEENFDGLIQELQRQKQLIGLFDHSLEARKEHMQSAEALIYQELGIRNEEES